MRTQHHSKRTDSLGRYYTNDIVSHLLVDQVAVRRPKAVVDLGSGAGALSIAASARWNQSDLITVDVDARVSDLVERIRFKGFRGAHAHLREDALSLELPRLLSGSGAVPNVGICNPPFLMQGWQHGHGELLEDVGLSGCLPVIASTEAAVLFLAQNLRVVAPGGVVGIIVPDSLANAEKYSRFRAKLLSRYSVERAIRLQRGSFGGTDALAHILVLRNRKPRRDQLIELCAFHTEHGLSQPVTVDAEDAAHRLDHQFHAMRSSVSHAVARLSSLHPEVQRGSLNSAQAKQHSSWVLHTTAVTPSMYGRWMDFSGNVHPSPSTSKAAVAEPGDILVGRVGRSAATKVVGVARGIVPFTDCLYRVRVPQAQRELLMRSLTSEVGRAWLTYHGFGVAAKHINKTDLLNLPLTADDRDHQPA
jgi:type I restriction enzyme M protein